MSPNQTIDNKRANHVDEDEALDVAAQGMGPTSDDAPLVEDDDDENIDEIDAIGEAAGLQIPPTKPMGGVLDEIDRRDAKRWELDPASAAGDPANGEPD
jgi:hypothetical protein